MSLITLQRVYDVHPPYTENTYLIDRLWPRGISKERLQGVIWDKEVAPSNELRKWYHANLNQWQEFTKKYQQELENSAAWTPLYQLIKSGSSITLLYGSKDPLHNHARVLRDYLQLKLNNR